MLECRPAARVTEIGLTHLGFSMLDVGMPSCKAGHSAAFSRIKIFHAACLGCALRVTETGLT